MTKSLSVCLFALCLLLFPASWGSASLTVEPDAQAKRDAIIDWSSSLHSFSGSYTRTYVSLDPSKPDKDIPKTYQLTYRFSGENQFLDFNPPDMNRRDRCAIIHGKYSQLLEYSNPPETPYERPRYTKPFDGVWRPPWPILMTMPPTVVFCQYIPEIGTTLKDFFAEGHTLLYKRNGAEVLVHRNPQYGRMEFELDDANRVVRWVWANDWDEKDLAPFYNGNPLDLYDPFSGITYSDYVQTNGVWFPMACDYISYSGGDMSRAIMERRNQGKVEPLAAEVEIATTVHFFESTVHQVRYNRENMLVNEPLDDTAFRIDAPEHAWILDPDGHPVVEKSRFMQWLRPRITIPITVILLTLVAGAVYVHRFRAR